MKRPKIAIGIVFVLVFLTVSLRAEKVANILEKEISAERDEVTAVISLIDEQQKHLLRIQGLKELMQEFKEQKKEFADGNQTQRLAFAMVSNAREILSGINEERIAHLFSPEYLEELIFFSSVAGKSRPSKP